MKLLSEWTLSAEILTASDEVSQPCWGQLVFVLFNKFIACYTIQLMHYSYFKTHSLQHLKPIKC